MPSMLFGLEQEDRIADRGDRLVSGVSSETLGKGRADQARQDC